MSARFILDAKKVYLFIEIAASALFAMIFVVASLYEATIAGLTPLQLVLVGTTLEIAVFTFEIPTGVVADAYSRRLSIIIGYFLMGAGFLVEGFFPSFVPILIAQVVWGLGYTFTSGATQAWISDEVGEESANQLFTRAAKVGITASIIGMALAIPLGFYNVALPLRVGGVGVALIAIVLIFIMPETGFHPTPKEDRNNWQHMGHIFIEGVRAVRVKPHLIAVLGVGFFFGLYSEGFDRLWVKHLFDTFELPGIFNRSHVAFFAALRITGSILTIFALQFVEKRVDSGSPFAIGQAMLIVTGVIATAMIGFAFSPLLSLTLILYLTINIFRSVSGPLSAAWVNQKLDSKVRATVHSMAGQVDAIGQIAGGPSVGVIAKFLTASAAIATSGFLLIPAMFLAGRANKISLADADAENTLPE